MNSAVYLKQLTRQIQNREVRCEIMKEYEEHIMDCKEALMGNGMTEEEAEEKAVEQMGDPKEAGIQMNHVYRKFIDWPMVKWMLGLGVAITLLKWIFTLLSGGQSFFEYYFPEIPYTLQYGTAVAITVYGFLLSVWEAYADKPLFYSFARDWNGYYYINSGAILAVAAAFFVKWKLVMPLILAMCFVQVLIRGFIAWKRGKKEARILWQIGTADTDIFPYKGYGVIDGKKQKVVTEEGEIKKGSTIVVTSLDGFRPVVEMV